MNRLFDLRFVIGAFFIIIGLLLLFYSIWFDTAHFQKINRYSGVGFLIFGIFMFILSLQIDASDEILSEDSDENT